MPEGVLVCDLSFAIIESNKAIADITGRNKQELIGINLSDLIILNKTGCPICKSNADSAFIPDQFSHIAEIRTKNGENVPVRINHKKNDNKQYICVISALSDIAFLNQAHMDFVSTVSHELRTPLTSIKGFADTLLAAGDRLDKEQQKRFISIIKTQIDRLTRLVENLLTVSRLESQKDKSIYKAITFKNFVEQLVHTISQKAQDHNINLVINPNLPQIWADSDKLEQIMTNLLDNAIKYSYKNTNIDIITSYVADNPDFVEIMVKDQGVGIPKEFQDKIFTKFSRIDNPLTSHVEGTGLGLYITKSLVESMGGRISLNSDDNGTTFILKLPVATPEKHTSSKFLEKD